MSVAFRRESDEEHKEPRFELPIPPGPNYVTARGRRLIEEQVAALTTALTSATAKEDAEAIRRDLRYWNTRLATAETAPTTPAGTVSIGSRVTFRRNGEQRVVTIVGADEAEPAAGRIGFAAPLARALIGAETGEHMTFGDVEDAIEIIAIEQAVNEEN